MPLLNNSISFILKYRYRNRYYSLFKYIIWQIVKLFGLFPRIIQVSNSNFLIENAIVANQGGTKLFTCGIYDYDNIMFIKYYFANNGGYFFDVGANIGVYSILISEVSNVYIYSFEPHPETFNLLKENLKINLRKNVFPENIAIGSRNSIVRLSNSPYSSINKVLTDTLEDGITINQFSLDEFIFANKICPDIIKIDDEGYEVDVLKGLKNNISSVKIIFVEANECNKIIEMLKNNFDGPYYINFKEKTLSNTKYYHEDPVFINKEFKKLLISDMNFQIIQ